jgi:hypothetical protein
MNVPRSFANHSLENIVYVGEMWYYCLLMHNILPSHMMFLFCKNPQMSLTFILSYICVYIICMQTLVH